MGEPIFSVSGQVKPMESYAVGLTELLWTYETTSEAFTSSRLMYRVFRAWSFANKHGFKLHDVMYRGECLTPREVECFNLWIRAGGAASASATLDHWQAVNLFENIRDGKRV